MVRAVHGAVVVEVSADESLCAPGCRHLEKRQVVRVGKLPVQALTRSIFAISFACGEWSSCQSSQSD